MEVIKQMMAQRAAMGLDNYPQSAKATKSTPAPEAPKPNGRQTLKQMREEIIANKKPCPKKVKKYLEEAIERLCAESSDDEDI